MKNEKAIAKLFKGCVLEAYDLIDGFAHVFYLRSKTGARMRYRLDEPDANERDFALKYHPMGAFCKEMRQEAALKSFLLSLVTDNTRLEPRAKEYLGR